MPIAGSIGGLGVSVKGVGFLFRVIKMVQNCGDDYRNFVNVLSHLHYILLNG